MAPVGSDIFPTLRACLRLHVSAKKDASNDSLYDVKFYPWPTADDHIIFAITGERHTYVCAIDQTHKDGFEILHWLYAGDSETSQNSVAWARDPVTGRPLICLAGHTPKYVKVIDAETGKMHRTILGHGRGVNDIAIHPLSPHILATASEDHNVRLFNLHPTLEQQPCVHMFAGGGSKQPILAMRFHPNGKWMLTGGMDTAVCLWSVPPTEQLEASELLDSEDQVLGEPITTYYPHFVSTEVHHNYVDCLEFYGDLIISRASKDQADMEKANEILIWKIEGFSADSQTVFAPPTPKPGQWTRSAFPHHPNTRGFQTLVTLSIPDTSSFYLRFSLLHQPNLRPILAMGTMRSHVHMWDLSQLELGKVSAPTRPSGRGRGRGRGGGRGGSRRSTSLGSLGHPDSFRRDESMESDGTANTPTGAGTPTTFNDQRSSADVSVVEVKKKSALEDPFDPIKAHASRLVDTILSPKKHFDTRQMAWSPDGKWLVGVGGNGMMMLFHRNKAAVVDED